METKNVQKQKEKYFSGKVDRNLFLICLVIILICITIIAGMLVQTKKIGRRAERLPLGLEISESWLRRQGILRMCKSKMKIKKSLA